MSLKERRQPRADQPPREARVVRSRIITEQGRRCKKTKFEGRCKDLEGHVYDISGAQQANQYMKTTEEIGLYVGQHYSHRGDIGTAVRTLERPVIAIPEDPLPDAPMAVKERWEDQLKQRSQRVHFDHGQQQPQPFSKRNKQRRQQQHHTQTSSNNRSDGTGNNSTMTSSLARATHVTNDDNNMNISTDNAPTIDLSVNESMISTALSGLFGDESVMEAETINNMVIPGGDG
jgi:hypothetical protein